jgi:hypothetical protein
MPLYMCVGSLAALLSCPAQHELSWHLGATQLQTLQHMHSPGLGTTASSTMHTCGTVAPGFLPLASVLHVCVAPPAASPPPSCPAQSHSAAPQSLHKCCMVLHAGTYTTSHLACKVHVNALNIGNLNLAAERGKATGSTLHTWMTHVSSSLSSVPPTCPGHHLHAPPAQNHAQAALSLEWCKVDHL